ncbi:RNA polymerase sigma factor [Mucilaginibacter limnophilus]|uniref:RNA polymerase sigma factor n=1 Tax=Mucilaginibacter limnophilus TaxID=1932778 RepID=UPI0013E408E6|nr:RNA polymerase sigma-70 factor [Mucilaginibacter limnophilus]
MANQLSETERIAGLIAGDENAFTLLYQEYSAKVYRLAYKFLKSKEQSEEIVQEAFINLWLSRQKLETTGNLWLYLYVITKRLSLNALRQVYKSADLTGKLLQSIKIDHNSTEEDILAHDLEQYTDKLIEKLPKQQQLIFKLSRIEGLSHKEIAEQLNISQNTVKNHMVEALKTLKQNLKYSDLLFFVALIHRF